MLVRKADGVEEETKWAMWLYHCHWSLHVTDRMTVTSLSASIPEKVRVATDHLCKTALNQKLSHKFEKWCKFSSHVKVKPLKRRPACTQIKTNSN